MFSDTDIDTFSIELELPRFEEKKNVVEDFIGKFPLSTMKFGKMQSILIAFKEISTEMPTMSFQGEGVSLTLGKKSLYLVINKVKSVGLEPGKEKVEDVNPFLEDNIKRISDDFNFVVAGIMGLLSLTSLKAEANVRISKDIEKDLFYDRFLMPDFWSKLQDCREKHVSGLQIEFVKDCMETNAQCKIRFGSNTKEEKEEKKKEITINESLEFDLKRPLALYAIIKEKLEMINTIYDNLAGDTKVV